MKAGTRDKIISQVYKSLKEPHREKTMSLLILLAEAEGVSGYWHDILASYVTKSPVVKESAPDIIDPFDRGKR